MNENIYMTPMNKVEGYDGAQIILKLMESEQVLNREETMKVNQLQAASLIS
ncbi:MAG TPA: hypothetical protein VE445_07180 [Nitrososphaeraceae archaeon]|nr:hypothetical protein [Nitrososphaeraceae archaeon]